MKILTIIMTLLISNLAIANNCQTIRQTYNCPGTEKYPLHLSFDDGPADLTPNLLDLLKKEKIQATFLLLAERIDCAPHRKTCISGDKAACQQYRYCLDHRNTAKRIKREGHMIGSHSYTHIRHSEIPVAAMKSNIAKSKHLLQPFFTTKPALFRLPYGDGWFNRNKTTHVMDELKKQGFKHLAWEMSAYDWRESDQKGDRILRTVMKEICTKKRGGVILFHDGDHEKPHEGRTFTNKNIAKWIPAMRCVADFKPLSFFYKDLTMLK